MIGLQWRPDLFAFMPWFIKQEVFTPAMRALPADVRRSHCEAHRTWLATERKKGWKLYSGFLVDEHEKPGGGGLMIFAATSYATALAWVTRDPMIHRGLVTWSLHAWRPVCADALPSSDGW